MDLVTKVKVSSVNNLTDARFFSGAGAEWLGFCFDESSEKYIPSEKVFQIKEWVAGPKIVAEFNNTPNQEDIRFAIDQIKADIIQIRGRTELSDIQKINTEVAVELLIQQAGDILSLEPYLKSVNDHAAYFLLNLKMSSRTDWNDLKQNKTALSVLMKLCSNYPIVLEFDFHKDNVNEIIETLSPYGISLTGGSELQTGVKSFEKIAELFEALEAEI